MGKGGRARKVYGICALLCQACVTRLPGSGNHQTPCPISATDFCYSKFPFAGFPEAYRMKHLKDSCILGSYLLDNTSQGID
jgi:hypothetical protein